MIVLLGASGYVGQAFYRALQQRDEPFEALSRKRWDYTRYEALVEYLRSCRPSFLINAAGYTGRPNVDACETARAETLQGNVVLPATISHACAATGTPWGHVSSGCIYNGAKIGEGASQRIETDLTALPVQNLVADNPDLIQGFSEADEPNFTFRRPPCSFYSGAKALAEDLLAADERAYVWRLRIPFNEVDNSRNYLSKLQRYPKVYDNVNSLSHLDDFAGACLELWRRGAPFGTYNVMNPGFVTARQVVGLIQRILRPERPFEFWTSDEEFYRTAATAPRSNCVLDATKLQAAGVQLRDVHEAIADALTRWQREGD